MKRETLLTTLSAINLVVLAVFGLAHILPASAQPTPGMLRGSGLEIVDAQGRPRATITIQPPADGATETVLLRLIQPSGQPAVKIAASVTGAGLSFVGGDDISYVILNADAGEAALKMKEPGGREHIVTP